MCRVVEQDIDSAEGAQREVDERLTLGRLAESAGLQRTHLAAGGSHHFDGRLRRSDVDWQAYLVEP